MQQPIFFPARSFEANSKYVGNTIAQDLGSQNGVAPEIGSIAAISGSWTAMPAVDAAAGNSGIHTEGIGIRRWVCILA